MLKFYVILLTQITNTSLWLSFFQRGFCFYSLRHTSDMKATLPVYTKPLIFVQNCVMSGLKVKKTNSTKQKTVVKTVNTHLV